MKLQLVVLFAACAWADTIRMKDGDPVHGIIRQMEQGKVSIETAKGVQSIDILEVEGIDFDTPHETDITSKDPDEQALARLARDLKTVRRDLRTQLDSIQKTFKDPNPARPYEAAQEAFRASMRQYQDTLANLHLRVLGQLEEYDAFAAEAGKVNFGRKGLFRQGSTLLTSELEKLPIRRFVPAHWYDTILFEGYRRGFVEGGEQQRLHSVPTKE